MNRRPLRCGLLKSARADATTRGTSFRSVSGRDCASRRRPGTGGVLHASEAAMASGLRRQLVIEGTPLASIHRPKPEVAGREEGLPTS